MSDNLENHILKEIALDVLKIALKDLGHRKPEVALDAACFLAGPDLPLFLAVALDGDMYHLRDSGCKLLAGVGNENK